MTDLMNTGTPVVAQHRTPDVGSQHSTPEFTPSEFLGYVACMIAWCVPLLNIMVSLALAPMERPPQQQIPAAVVQLFGMNCFFFLMAVVVMFTFLHRVRKRQARKQAPLVPPATYTHHLYE